MMVAMVGNRVCRFRVLAAAVWMLATVAASAQEKIALRWKFTSEQQLIWTIQQQMDMSMLVGDMPIDSKMKMQIGMTWQVIEVDASGSAKMRITIDHVVMDMQGAGMQAHYDTRQPDDKAAAGPLAAAASVFQALTKIEYTLRMDPRGEVSDVELTAAGAEALKSITGNLAAMGPIGDMAGPDGMKQMLSQTAAPFPEQAVAVGDTWDATQEMKNPVFGKQEIVSHFKYEGLAEQAGRSLDKITATIDLNFDAPKLPGVEKLEIPDREMTQTVWFDREAGRIRRSETDTQMTIKLTAMGQLMEQEIDMQMVVNSRTPDEPAEDSSEADKVPATSSP